MTKINIFKTVLLSSVLTCSMTSCELDQFPNDSIVAEKAWQTVDDAEKFRIGIYSCLRSVNGGKYVYISDIQSDLLNATISYANIGGDMHRWDFTASQYDIEDTWKGYYRCINNCNNIIQNVDKIAPASDEEKAKLSNIKGEAFFIRALSYHNLALRFAKDYNPKTAESNLGLPLVTEMDPLAKPSRSSLADTYKRVTDDITEVRKYLKAEGEANSTYLTIDALDLFEARVYMYMENFGEAIKLAEKTIAKYPLVSTEADIKDMWLNDKSSEVLFRCYQSIDERENQMDMYLAYNTSSKNYQPYYVPSKWVYDLYEDSDIRKKAYFLNSEITCMDVTVDDVYMLYKYPGNPDLKKKDNDYYNMAKIFRSAEAYLIASESAFMNNEEAKALSFLNSLRTKRGATALNVSGENLKNAIEDEWTREFVGEGFRLDLLKRWNKGMARHDAQNNSILMKGDGFINFSKEASDMRFVWEIPNNDLNSNINLERNWK